MAGKAPKVLDQESQLKDIRRQLSDQLGCLEFRTESKLSLLTEFQEFFKRRGEVEYEYARSIERLCEKFERNTKQRNLHNEVRSTFNLWSTLLAEARKTSRERAALAEILASEMVARLDIMAKDVQMLAKRCKELCIEIQDQFLKELRDLSEQTKVYQHSCHNAVEAYSKVIKAKEKVDAVKGATARRKKFEEKFLEKQKQYKVQKHLLLKNRNDYLLGITRCNALSSQYFSRDIMDIVEYMDFDYHDSFRRLVLAYKDNERETCEALMQSSESLVEQTKNLNLENDLHYFLSEYSNSFSAPNYFQFTSFQGDDVSSFKVNTEDVFKRWSKTMADLREEIQTLQIQREEDVKTIQHMKQVNLKKYQVTSVDDALAVIEDNGDSLGLDGSKERGNASLERGLSLTTRGGQALVLSQKGKKDTLNFTLQISQRRILRADRLAVACGQLDILEKAFDEQKVPPVPVGLDSQGRAIPGEVPKLFGGEIVKYISATGCEIPLIVESCVRAIEAYGMKMEGLFRVPGPAAVLDELRIAFEEGRDPLARSSSKLDVAAVASTLKAYFRELRIPLFPTDKYQEFINCTRQEDLQSRLNVLSATINSLPPQVIAVMRFLFRFLYRVSLHAAENKMGSANLALVFGPTLTRAPDSLDPRQLHNDVPSVNVLIQMCIDGHDYLFGEEEEDTPRDVPTASPSRDEVEKPLPSTSPPAEPPTAPPNILDSPPVSPIHQLSGFNDEVCELPPPPRPPRHSMEIQLPPGDAPPPPRPPKPETMSPPPPPPTLTEEPPQIEAEVPAEVCPPDTRDDSVGAIDGANVGDGDKPVETEIQEPVSGGDTSGLDLSILEAQMQEINDSIQEMDLNSESASALAPAEKKVEDDIEEEDDSDSEDEDEGEDGMRISARSLYDYTARSDKELTFSRGDVLQVITKTPDNNWWDGFHSGRRGFIPVAYVEITELKTTPSPPVTPISAPAASVLPVPAPPQRKSSMPPTSDAESVARVSEAPQEPNIVEECGIEVEQVEHSTPDPATSQMSPLPEAEPADMIPPSLTVSNDEGKGESLPEIEGNTEAEPLRANFPVKSVRSLTKQFQEPEPSQPKVLVEPHTHRRHDSDVLHKVTPDPSAPFPPRSTSGGNKVSMLSSNFQNKVVTGPPPPTRPKPPLSHPPTSPVGPTSDAAAGVFPLHQHGGAGMPGASPLQRAALQSQHGPKPTPPGKKPPQAVKAPVKSKGAVKLKKKDSIKDKDKEKEKGSKPPPNPKPPAVFAATSKEIQAQLQAHAAKRKHN